MSSITNILPNLRKHFTEDNTPEGKFDGRKVILGGIAVIGAIAVIAATVGLTAGVPLFAIGLIGGGAAIALSLRKLYVLNSSSQAPPQENLDPIQENPEYSSIQNQRSNNQKTTEEMRRKYSIEPKNNNQKPIPAKAGELNNSAKEFASNAEKLKKKFINKSWYEIW